MQKLGNKRQAYDARECAMTVEAALQKIGDAILVRADEDSIHVVIRMGLAGNSSGMTHCCLTRQQDWRHKGNPPCEEVGTRCNSDANLTQDEAVATYTELTSGKTIELGDSRYVCSRTGSVALRFRWYFPTTCDHEDARAHDTEILCLRASSSSCIVTPLFSLSDVSLDQGISRTTKCSLENGLLHWRGAQVDRWASSYRSRPRRC